MQRLTEIRQAMGLTGAAFARLIGASPGQLHNWESGRNRLTLAFAAKIEAITGHNGLLEAIVAAAVAASTPFTLSPSAPPTFPGRQPGAASKASLTDSQAGGGPRGSCSPKGCKPGTFLPWRSDP